MSEETSKVSRGGQGDVLDLDKLELVAKAAPKGPYKLRKGFECDTKELYVPEPTLKKPYTEADLARIDVYSPEGVAYAKFAVAANPDVVLELIRRVRAAEGAK